MEDAKFLKSYHWLTYIGIPVIILSAMFYGLALFTGEIGFRFVFAAIMMLMAALHLVLMLISRNSVYGIPLVFYLFVATTFYSLIFPVAQEFVVFSAIIALAAFCLFSYVLLTRQIKWRYREILELAARSVKDSEDGFTARPYHVAKKNYRQDELKGFARFLLKHMIVYPIAESDRMVFVIPGNMLLYIFHLRRDYRNDTYLVFGIDGNVSVQIAQKDYSRYKEQLTFDQLCESFGNLFLEFLSSYRKEDGQNIIERMNDLRFIG